MLENPHKHKEPERFFYFLKVTRSGVSKFIAFIKSSQPWLGDKYSFHLSCVPPPSFKFLIDPKKHKQNTTHARRFCVFCGR